MFLEHDTIYACAYCAALTSGHDALTRVDNTNRCRCGGPLEVHAEPCASNYKLQQQIKVLTRERDALRRAVQRREKEMRDTVETHARNEAALRAQLAAFRC